MKTGASCTAHSGLNFCGLQPQGFRAPLRGPLPPWAALPCAFGAARSASRDYVGKRVLTWLGLTVLAVFPIGGMRVKANCTGRALKAPGRAARDGGRGASGIPGDMRMKESPEWAAQLQIC